MARSTKLSDLQLILLSTACQRDDGSLFPPPESVGEQGNRIRKAVASLIKRGFAQEADAVDPGRTWRSEGDRKVAVIISEVGRKLIAGEAPSALPRDNVQPHSPELGGGQVDSPSAPQPPPAQVAVRAGTKQALLIELLQRENGSSIDELTAATNWLPHTTRAALTGLRKRGMNVVREKVENVTRYRIAGQQA